MAQGVVDEGSSTGASSSSAAQSDSSVTQAQQALTQAEQSLDQAKQQKSQAWEQCEKAASAYAEVAAETSKLTVTATMSGIVTEVNVAKGDQVGAGSSSSGSSGTYPSGASTSTASSGAAVTISDESSLSLTVQVDEGNINQIKKGQSAQVTVTALEEQIRFVSHTLKGVADDLALTAAVGTLYPTLEGLAPVVSPALVLVVFGICAGIGVVFGWYPARRAARLSPADTLRYQ